MKKILTLLLILALLVGAVVVVKKKMTANSATPAIEQYALNVKTFTPKEGNVTLSTPVLALVKNDHDASLSAKSPASVLYISSAGTHVKKGDVIIRLDNNDLMAQKEAIKLSLNNEMSAHQRSRELYAVKGVSLEQLQNEESHIAILKADLTRVSNQIDYTIIHAPAEGVVGETFAAVGDVAAVGKILASIRAASGGYLWVRVALGTPAKTLLYENNRASLRFLQNANGMDEYRADMTTSLPSGARIETKMVIFEGSGIYLPRETVLLKEGKAYVLVIEGHGAKAHEITIIARGDEGFVTTNVPSGRLALAKSDILLKLLGGSSVAIKE